MILFEVSFNLKVLIKINGDHHSYLTYVVFMEAKQPNGCSINRENTTSNNFIFNKFLVYVSVFQYKHMSQNCQCHEI